MRDSWVLALSLGGLAILAFVWLCGWLAAPARHPELARVVLHAAGTERQLAGASFDCAWDDVAGRRVCATAVRGRRLALQRAAHSCKATLAGRAVPCRLDYALVAGFPSMRVDVPAPSLDHVLLTATPHYDLVGTRSECEWGRVAQASGVLVPVLLVGAWARYRGPATRWQWAWRIFGILVSIVPLWVLMLHTLLRWRYLD